MLMEAYGHHDEAMLYYLHAGMWSEAETMHGNLPLDNEEETNYAWLAGLAIDLYGSEKTWDSLDTETRDSIQGMIAENSLGGYFAGSICEYLGIQNTIWPLPVYDTAEYDNYARQGKGEQPEIGSLNKKEYSFSLYPNPTNGNFIVDCLSAGKLAVYSIDGRKQVDYQLKAGKTELSLPANVLPGLYIGRYTNNKDGREEVIRILYQQ